MSGANRSVPHPEAPKGTLPFGAGPAPDHPQAPPGCIPSNHATDISNTVQPKPSILAGIQYNPAGFATPPPSHTAQVSTEYRPAPSATNFPPPPPRNQQHYLSTDDPSDPAHYMRNPSKLIAYLVPFPPPRINVPTSDVPQRFMIYTPPPPPLHAPDPNDPQKEARMHKIQRKWQSEVRAAKTSTAKTVSWKGVKSKATKGIKWAMNQTTSSNLEFLGRVSPSNSDSEREKHSGGDGAGSNSNTAKKTVPVDEMMLVYPSTMNMTDTQMREEFVNTMLRTKSKAQRDAIIATGLMPVAFGIDVMLTLVWPFGGLVEIDGLWGWSSFRGAKTARSVTKRLGSASKTQNPYDEDAHNDPHPNPSSTSANPAPITTASNTNSATNDPQLKLTFVDSTRVEILRRYLEAECHRLDSDVFPTYHTSPTESQVLEAIGWEPEHCGGETRNWENEEWETSEVKEDVKVTFRKAAKEWKQYVLLLEENPEKAAKK